MLTAQLLGYSAATLDQVPLDQQEQIKVSMSEMNLSGMGPATIWRRGDGSFTVLSAEQRSPSLRRSKPLQGKAKHAT